MRGSYCLLNLIRNLNYGFAIKKWPEAIAKGFPGSVCQVMTETDEYRLPTLFIEALAKHSSGRPECK